MGRRVLHPAGALAHGASLGVSTATFYKWRAKYGGMDTSMMSKLKELEEEKLKADRL